MYIAISKQTLALLINDQLMLIIYNVCVNNKLEQYNFDTKILFLHFLQGKEIIGVFGYRFGKSGMSLALSGLTSVFGNFGLKELSYLTTGASFLWLTTAWQLSNKVLTRTEAEQAYKKVKGL